MEITAPSSHVPWNKGKLVGQKAPFKLKEISAMRIRLQIARRCRDLALFNLAIDSKLRACDLMSLRVRDVCHGQSMASRALIRQQKTSRPVQFEITAPFDAPICSDRGFLGAATGIGFCQLWHAYAATHESDTDLPADQCVLAKTAVSSHLPTHRGGSTPQTGRNHP
jgi:hypothetical protein